MIWKQDAHWKSYLLVFRNKKYLAIEVFKPDIHKCHNANDRSANVKTITAEAKLFWADQEQSVSKSEHNLIFIGLNSSTIMTHASSKGS